MKKAGKTLFCHIHFCTEKNVKEAHQLFNNSYLWVASKTYFSLFLICGFHFFNMERIQLCSNAKITNLI